MNEKLEQQYPFNIMISIMDKLRSRGYISGEDCDLVYSIIVNNDTFNKMSTEDIKLLTDRMDGEINNVMQDRTIHKDVLFLRYKEHKMLKEIAIIYGCTIERVRQLTNKCFLKLVRETKVVFELCALLIPKETMYQSYLKYKIMSVFGTLQYYSDLEKVFPEYLSEKYDIDWFMSHEELILLASVGIKEYVKILLKENENLKHQNSVYQKELGIDECKENAMGDMPIISVDAMNLSTRAYNCMCLTGFNTSKDIIEFIVDKGVEEHDPAAWIYFIKNLGVHTALEILNKLESLGANINEYKDALM